MIVIGLTGSIGMGKTTTAGLLAEEGAAVFDADAVVADLYASGGAAVDPVGEAFPGVVKDGAIDRQALTQALRNDPEGFERLERIVHPMVAATREKFFADAEAAGTQFAVLDVPLLFEVGLDDQVDVVMVVTAPSDVQRARVLARPGMTADKLDAILARQLPDSEKRARADYVIDTSKGIEEARRQVRAALQDMRSSRS
ncbi:dephospho-CoA kinase [Marinicauda algicola]|uniref:Dephospho-CoA kinase n=1 Tax=Marinicauda algicola TaxID=2029849 RepID=A0A4S2H0V1_9PROT|nr:dephospho-CoA kinase [Marinicauda algicola]TGY89023.1 dephospho-CoA kinase [Marinicauda algicola]